MVNSTLLRTFSLAAASIIYMSAADAARVLDLSTQSGTILSAFTPKASLRTTGLSLRQTASSTDFNHTTHVRMQEIYQGYPVWGSEFVAHFPQGIQPSLTAAHDVNSARKITMDGVLYQDLRPDLAETPAYIFNQTQADKALAAAIQYYRDETHTKFSVENSDTKLMVYVDDKQHAHWMFNVTFKTSYINGMPAKPVYLMDAVTFDVYEHWNNLKTANAPAAGGGVGGNGRMGKMIYDGGEGHRPVLNIERNESNRACYLRNDTVIIRDRRYHDEVPYFRCEKPDGQHYDVFWNTLDDSANGGYSPNNDGIYSDSIVREMYQKWFGINMLEKNGKPMQVIFYVHDPLEGQNAYYEDGKMVFGDGDSESYPVVAPSVVAHEMSHGFTEHHSALNYRGQSGGIDESFSDMADKAVEYYVYGKNNWDIDPELLKDGGRMLRYMDEPTKDCEGKKEGEECSISHFKDYHKSMNVHHSSGIFNKAFYLIATQWDTHRAFEIMVHANRHYWTANTNFAKAACGVVKAARDYKYDETVVKNAMREVGVSTGKC